MVHLVILHHVHLPFLPEAECILVDSFILLKLFLTTGDSLKPLVHCFRDALGDQGWMIGVLGDILHLAIGFHEGFEGSISEVQTDIKELDNVI